jgi:hypothetical protein
MKSHFFILTVAGSLLAAVVQAAGIAVGAAPKGDAGAVASRIIKYNFPSCKRVAGAVRQPDGSIRAACDGTQYLVFTVFNSKEGKVIELALNCTAARKMDIKC